MSAGTGPGRTGPAHRYVFVGGLHRSGTSPLTRMIEGLPGVSGISGAPVPEQEGVYLQGAIPHTALHGRPMHFATDPAQHHVEGSIYDRLDVRERIEADWAPWFAPGAAWRVEKSPPNMTRTRLYQQLFPLSHQVVILRHPQAVHGAVSKWVDLGQDGALAHWLEAHARLRADLAHLHHVLVIRYEDLVADPDRYRRGIAAFLGIEAEGAAETGLADRNHTYPGWALSDDEAAACAEWGYASDMGVTEWTPVVNHALNAVREKVLRILT